MARTKITVKKNLRPGRLLGIQPRLIVNVHYPYSNTLSLAFPPWSIKDSLMMEVDVALEGVIIKPFNYIDLTNDDTMMDDTSKMVECRQNGGNGGLELDEEHDREKVVLPTIMEEKKRKRKRSETIGCLTLRNREMCALGHR